MISWSTINWTSQGFPLPLTTQRHNPSFKDYCPPQALRNLVPDPNGLSWLSDNDIWVEQWPIIKPKLTALKELVNEQLGLGHLEPSTNGHNTPIFVIYKRSIHYWSLWDLHAVNEQMEKNGHHTAWLAPSQCHPPSRHIFILHIKDCFLRSHWHQQINDTLPSLHSLGTYHAAT